MKLRLILIANKLYRMEVPEGLPPLNSLPKIRFERNKNNEVTGLTILHDDGNEEFVEKK